MLTQECKNAMFPTVEDFENIYIKNMFKTEKEYDFGKWYTNGNKTTYIVTLYENMLATGNSDNIAQEYFTLIQKDDGNYEINVNSYIYGENRNIETTERNITFKIGQVDVYNEYEEAQIIVTNNTSKKICLTGNKYNKNIYLENTSGTIYSSIYSEFDNDEIVIQPNTTRNFKVRFNKTYGLNNKSTQLVLSDVILDYDGYLKAEDKTNYWNRTEIEVEYEK